MFLIPKTVADTDYLVVNNRLALLITVAATAPVSFYLFIHLFYLFIHLFISRQVRLISIRLIQVETKITGKSCTEVVNYRALEYLSKGMSDKIEKKSIVSFMAPY